jgi:hypothetical protein
MGLSPFAGFTGGNGPDSLISQITDCANFDTGVGEFFQAPVRLKPATIKAELLSNFNICENDRRAGRARLLRLRRKCA